MLGTSVIPFTAQETEKPLSSTRENWEIGSDSGQETISKIQEKPTNDPCYGFLINVTENQSYGLQINITRFLNILFNQNVSIYWIACDITLSVQCLENGSEIESRTFQKGCFIIAFSNDSVMNTKIIALVYQKWLTSRLSVYKIIQPSLNFTGYRLLEPRIACYNSTSVDHYNFPRHLEEAGFTTVDLLTSQQTINNLTIDNYDIFIWGGGGQTFSETINDTLSITGLHVKNHIRKFVGAGGNYIGTCYGGWRAASGYQRPWGYPLDFSFCSLLNLVPIQLELLKYNVYHALPGAGKVTLTLTNMSHPLAFGLPNHLPNVNYFAGPLFISTKGLSTEKEIIGVLSDVNSNQWWDYNFQMGFVPFWNCKIFSNATKYRIAHQWMNKSIGAAMWIDSTFGVGKVIVFGVHPEFTWALDGNEEWFSAPRIIYNTIWYATAQEPLTYVLGIPVTFSNILVDAGGPYITEVDQLIQVHGAALNGGSPFKWYWERELTYNELHHDRYPYNTTQEGQHPWFSFPDFGTYQVTLVVTDASGNIGYDTATVTVIWREKIK